MKKLLFTLAMVCCLAVSLLPAAVHAEGSASSAAPPPIPTEGNVWDGVTITKPTKIVRKDGVNYYEISTCAELAFVAQTGGDWLGRNYLLKNHLILNDVVLECDAEGNLLNAPRSLHPWTPIGSQKQFTGIFDGGGFTISGL